MQKHYNITIRGKVQGVWYRATTQRKAQELELKGFVRNQADGNVYAEAEGDEANLLNLVEWCKSGPPLARVDEVIVEESELKGFNIFRITK
ncbi:MAG: acylphosphatase [Bacteroidetes bacterium]|nr:acylphosphatase [Bacteroidota bacterium]